MLNRIQIKNFKCHDELDLRLAPMTILVGGNASGKSTVIQALLLAKQLFDIKRRKPMQEEDQWLLRGKIQLNGVDTLQLGRAMEVLSANASSRDIEITLVSEEVFEAAIRLSIPLNEEEPILNGRSEMKKETFFSYYRLFNGSGFSYISAERIGPRKALEMTASTYFSVGAQGEYTAHVLSVADSAMRRQSVHPTLLKAESQRFSHHVEGWLETIIPGQQLNYSYIPDVTMLSMTYNRYHAPNTGFGISYVLPIIVSGLYCSLKSNALLVIENPEAHLHPMGQSRVGNFLAQVAMAGVQVIVETHSEHVVNGARLAFAMEGRSEEFMINFFANTNGQIQVQEIGANDVGELTEWPRGFFDQEQIDLRNLMLLRKSRR